MIRDESIKTLAAAMGPPERCGFVADERYGPCGSVPDDSRHGYDAQCEQGHEPSIDCHPFQPPAPTPEALREHTHTAAIRYDGRWHTVAVSDHDVWYVDGKPIEAMASIATFDRALTPDEVAGIARAVFAADALLDDRLDEQDPTKLLEAQR